MLEPMSTWPLSVISPETRTTFAESSATAEVNAASVLTVTGVAPPPPVVPAPNPTGVVSAAADCCGIAPRAATATVEANRAARRRRLMIEDIPVCPFEGEEKEGDGRCAPGALHPLVADGDGKVAGPRGTGPAPGEGQPTAAGPAESEESAAGSAGSDESAACVIGRHTWNRVRPGRDSTLMSP